MIESKVGIGTVQFGMPYGISNKIGQTQSEEVSRILNYASLNSICILDTASAYGTSESILGQNELRGFKIVSKFVNTKNRGELRELFKCSLTDLKVKSLYGYLSHNPLELLKNPSLWDELDDLKNQNLIVKRGFSVYEPCEIAQLLDKGFIPDLVQVPFNYLDRRFEKILIDLKQLSCEIHARSVFLQGLFFKNPVDLPDFFDLVKPIISQFQLTNKMLSCALLKFVIDQPFIDKAIIGVESLRQLKENMSGLELGFELPVLDIIIPDAILMPSRWPKEP